MDNFGLQVFVKGTYFVLINIGLIKMFFLILTPT